MVNYLLFRLSLSGYLTYVVKIGGGFVKKWEELAVIRLLLGVMEAGFFPGKILLSWIRSLTC